MEHREMTVSNCNDWATHSPGPWEHQDGKVYGGGVLVATLDPAVMQEEVAMKEADARLIAAAPDLLLVLMQLVDDPRDETPGIWSDAYEAVMRATGRPDTRIGGSGGEAENPRE